METRFSSRILEPRSLATNDSFRREVRRMAVVLLVLGAAAAAGSPTCLSSIARASRAAPHMSQPPAAAEEQLAAEQKRLVLVLAQVQTDLHSLKAERRALDRSIDRKRQTQGALLEQLGTAYSRAIVEARKAAFLELVAEGSPPPPAARVDLLASALLAALPSTASAPPQPPAGKSWRQAYPKPSFFASLFGRSQPPPADCVPVDSDLLIAKGPGGTVSAVFVS
jgi:hypothetical protein